MSKWLVVISLFLIMAITMWLNVRAVCRLKNNRCPDCNAEVSPEKEDDCSTCGYLFTDLIRL